MPVSFFYILFSFRLIFIGMPFLRIGSVIYNLEEYHLTYIRVIFEFYWNNSHISNCYAFIKLFRINYCQNLMKRPITISRWCVGVKGSLAVCFFCKLSMCLFVRVGSVICAFGESNFYLWGKVIFGFFSKNRSHISKCCVLILIKGIVYKSYKLTLHSTELSLFFILLRVKKTYSFFGKSAVSFYIPYFSIWQYFINA